MDTLFFFEKTKSRIEKWFFLFFIYHFHDFMFFTDLDNAFTRFRALGWLFDPAL